ncbi:MAG: hypothetical protein IPK98_07105 [Chloracidobacterium sp.]|nr:hypothetical protein [Chloracidobacterium sp.]
MNQLDFLGQTLDGKYHIERELGRGGMGTVYLATHLGTERPVAVKIIAPQYMKRRVCRTFSPRGARCRASASP